MRKLVMCEIIGKCEISSTKEKPLTRGERMIQNKSSENYLQRIFI